MTKTGCLIEYGTLSAFDDDDVDLLNEIIFNTYLHIIFVSSSENVLIKS